MNRPMTFTPLMPTGYVQIEINMGFFSIHEFANNPASMIEYLDRKIEYWGQKKLVSEEKTVIREVYG